jgi:hypothetical protein
VILTKDDSASARAVTVQSCQTGPSGGKPTASGAIVSRKADKVLEAERDN